MRNTLILLAAAAAPAAAASKEAVRIADRAGWR